MEGERACCPFCLWPGGAWGPPGGDSFPAAEMHFLCLETQRISRWQRQGGRRGPDPRSDRPSSGRLQRPSECGKFAGWKREAAGFLPGCAIPHRGFSLRFREVVNLYAGQEAAVRTGHAPTAWFQTGKGARQGCIWSPCLFYAENIMRNAGLEEAQAGIKMPEKYQ